MFNTVLLANQLTSDRGYRHTWTDDEVIEWMRKQKGRHFDPRLVDIFLENINEFFTIKEKYNTPFRCQ